MVSNKVEVVQHKSVSQYSCTMAKNNMIIPGRSRGTRRTTKRGRKTRRRMENGGEDSVGEEDNNKEYGQDNNEYEDE